MASVRRAGASDLPELFEIDARAAGGDEHRRTYLAQAIDQDICLLAHDGGHALGFVVVRRRHFFDRDFIDLLVVAEGARRRGVGAALVGAAVQASTSDAIFTSTNESNAPMQALLDAGGWRFSGRLDGLDDGDPELVYFIQR